MYSKTSHSAESSESSGKNMLVLIPDSIDVEEEARFYDDISASTTGQDIYPYGQHSPTHSSPESPTFGAHETQSVFSKDIWLGDSRGESAAFARDVEVPGWTSVGDRRGGAYVVYDCVIKTKEGTVIHALKRYSAFAQLAARLRATLPASQQLAVPALPPKFPLAKFRPTFLDQRRRLLQHWLAAVLLHPEVGGCQAVREWVVDRS
ncbi:Phox-like protein [Epithele typhae]|uniref:Phox-like protein n=1 Tax=Epithele typhae TaxID=378194 RepID=UPI002007F25A|nr:Phox-like protein [Epithele typhae]KAH9914509.1 Phox-like protein [Epithele typhae]